MIKALISRMKLAKRDVETPVYPLQNKLNDEGLNDEQFNIERERSKVGSRKLETLVIFIVHSHRIFWSITMRRRFKTVL